MPVATRDHDSHEMPWGRDRRTPPGIIAIPKDPHITELLTQAHLVTERLEEDRATTFLNELLHHHALPADAFSELRHDLLTLEAKLRAQAGKLRAEDPNMQDYRTASAHMDFVSLRYAGRILDRGLARAGILFTAVEA